MCKVEIYKTLTNTSICVHSLITYQKSPQNENLNLLVGIKLLNLFYNNISKQKLKNVLVRTKFYWS